MMKTNQFVHCIERLSIPRGRICASTIWKVQFAKLCSLYQVSTYTFNGQITM